MPRLMFHWLLGLLPALFWLALSPCFAQNPDWFIVPKMLSFTPGPGIPVPLSGAFTTPYNAANLTRDAQGNVLFYVVDEKIYDPAGTVIGTTWPLPFSTCRDIIILPDPLDCQARLILSAYSDIIVGSGSYYVCFLFVTRVSKTGTTWNIQQNYFNTMLTSLDNPIVAMTVSQPRSGGVRSWYVATSNGIDEYLIYTNGNIQHNQFLSFYKLFPTDLEVSPDGTMLVWSDGGLGSNYDLYSLHISTGGVLQNLFNHQDIGLLGGPYQAYGLEFEDNIHVLVSAVNASGSIKGIFRQTLNAPTVTPIALPGSSNFGKSQLEKALDGKIYGASSTGLWGVDPLGNSTAIPIPVTSSGSGWFTNLVYSLPKQLDYETYPTVFSCCPGNITITGNYAVALTESQDWIVSGGTCTIPAAATVKLDADPVSGYVQLNPGFLADWRTGGSVFIAQAFNGCSAGAPVRPDAPAEERAAESATAETFRVFPNPLRSGLLTIVLPEQAQGGALMVRVVDMAGQIRQERQILPNESGQQMELDLSALADGMYILSIAAENGARFTQKLAVVRS